MASVAPAPSSLPARAPPLSFKPIVVRGTQDSVPATPPRLPPKSARQQEKSKVVESNHRRTRTASGLWRIAPRISLASVLRKPRIIATFLRYTSWEDFRGLARSSSEYRSLLRHTESKDVVLSHFVPGYRYCLHLADIANFRDVDITFRDLELFMASQRVLLHIYPMHALSIISALYITPELNHKTLRYVALSQAHSRFVLLLQSLIHSSSLPFSEEPQEARPKLRYGSFLHPSPNVRELVFPAPLSYLPPSPPPDFKPPALSRKSSSWRKKKGSVVSKSAPPTVHPIRPRLESIASSSLDFLSERPSQLPTRKSLFVGNNVKVPPPPPSSDPLALRLYTNTWRTPRRPSYFSASAVSDDESVLFRRPHRRFVTNPNESSSQSSLDYSPDPSSRRARSQSQHSNARTQHSFVATAPSPINSIQTSASSPHDIRMATSRLRAPILRVFHPCTELDENAIGACEEQLIDAGLWEHLSTGDIVCNLGYMPPEEPQGSSSDVSSDQSSGFQAIPPTRTNTSGSASLSVANSRAGATKNNGSGSGSGSSSGSTAQPRQTWLMFDGSQLVTYSPPSPPALSDPLALPSPLYYAHIFPVGTNPVYNLKMPRVEGIERHRGADEGIGGVTLTLASGERWVKSPHSPAGVARARKFMWILRLPPAAFVTVEGDGREGMGDGWLGDWVLEAEGTKEGRESLVWALSGHDQAREWELVVEKSSGGCIWLRLVTSSSPPNAPEGPPSMGLQAM